MRPLIRPMKLLAAAAFALIALTLVVPASAANAAAATPSITCNGAGCAGKNPNSYDCAADSRTYTVELVGVDRLGFMAGLELRYSPKCNANWARLTAQSYTPAWVSICVVNDANRNDIQCLSSVRNGYIWSPMIDGNKKVFASVGYSLDSGGGGNAWTDAF